MQKRSVVGVIALTIVTLGIYSVYWHVKTKQEMVELGADIPTSWLIIVPVANIYWYWKWCGGVEYTTRGRMSQPVTIMLSLLLGLIGVAIIQDSLNKAIDNGLPNRMPSLPEARIA